MGKKYSMVKQQKQNNSSLSALPPTPCLNPCSSVGKHARIIFWKTNLPWAVGLVRLCWVMYRKDMLVYVSNVWTIIGSVALRSLYKLLQWLICLSQNLSPTFYVYSDHICHLSLLLSLSLSLSVSVSVSLSLSLSLSVCLSVCWCVCLAVSLSLCLLFFFFLFFVPFLSFFFFLLFFFLFISFLTCLSKRNKCKRVIESCFGFDFARHF